MNPGNANSPSFPEENSSGNDGLFLIIIKIRRPMGKHQDTVEAVSHLPCCRAIGQMR